MRGPAPTSTAPRPAPHSAGSRWPFRVPSGSLEGIAPRPRHHRRLVGPQPACPAGMKGTSMGKHRLVALGDSLTQGFMSGAIFATDLAYPALIAAEMGLDPSGFRVPGFSTL